MDNPPKKPRTAWSTAPYCHIVLPHCMTCGSLRYRLTKSEANGDGSVTRKAVCLDCGKPFKIVAEPPTPEFGNVDSAASIMEP